MFSPNPHLVEEATCFPFFLHLDTVCNELNSRMPVEQEIRFYVPLELSCCLSTAMSSLTGNHTIDLFYLLKENFKNLLFGLLITGRGFENLSYLSSCSFSQR